MGTMRITFLLVTCFLILNSIIILGQDECSPALSALKQSLKFDTQKSSKLIYWNSSTPCCSWSGVACQNGQVVALNLSSEGITGGLDNSSSLFDLQSLKTLDFTNNNFSTPIPAAIGRLVNMENLNLSEAGFMEQIPVGIARMTKLRILRLSYNPLEFGLLNLTLLVHDLSNLEELWLDGLNISYQGSDWSRALAFSLPNLRVLSLNGCNLFGPPDASLLRLHKLSSITLGSNTFFSPFPKIFVRFPNLRLLKLDNCGIQGTIPHEIFSIPSLEYLDISANPLLGGSLPEFSINGSLHKLKLSSTNVSGNLPSSIGNLVQLSTLSLANCGFNGHLPYSIQNLSRLESLDLSFNMISGPLPDFSRLRKLTFLSLAYNFLTGALPSSLFVLPSCSGDLGSSIQNVSWLEHLDLSNNKLSGPLPDFSCLRKLAHLSLAFNFFTGPLPSSLFALSYSIQSVSRLQYLDLSDNRFSGSLPDLSRLRNLTTLSLARNYLTGVLPSSLFALPFLNSLDLSSNRLSGMLPDSPYAFSSSMFTMYLGSNKLEGALPLSLFNFPNINFLDLSFNNFSGRVELSDLQKLKNLTALDLSFNSLTIATDRSNLSSFANGIYRLGLASCNLDAFPNFVNHSRFDYLDLSNNQIQGEIPKWIWNIVQVNLSNNLLEGFERPLPRKHSTFVEVIDLHHNMLRGPLPLLPEDASYIDYSYNRLTSTIPIDIGSYLSSTIFFSLSTNQIIGTLPLSMCNATNLQILDLSNNSLGGTIPQCLFNMSSDLEIVNLSGNKLNGKVPATFSHVCALKTLDLNHNMVEGEIPRRLANCKALEVLNLAQNKIHDTFPCFLKGLPNLRVLVLRSNELTGPVWCSNTMNSNLWRRLQIIDLSGNKLYGDLPSEFISQQNAMTGASVKENLPRTPLDYYSVQVTIVYKDVQQQLVKILTAFNLVDLSNNMFSGEIPEEVGRLTAVHGLNLSHNVLTGQIPSTLEKMKALESLDLSYNSLNGSIPEQLGRMNFLEWLNLSYNQLEGMIPSGGQFLTFQESSFIGNKGLCGSPLSIKCKDARGSTSSNGSSKTVGRPSHASFLIDLDFMMVGIEVGFIFGLILTIGPLVFYARWSRNYFMYVDKILLNTFGLRRQRRHVSIIQ